MATTAEIAISGIILFTNTVAVIISYYIGDVVLAPLLNLANSWNIHPALQASMWETSYIYPAFFGLLLILEIISIIGFAYVLARRQVSPFDY